MKNISITLASVLSISFIIPIIDKAIAKPTKSQLPKVGVIKGGVDVTHGCFYYQPDSIIRKLEEARSSLVIQHEKLYKDEKNKQKQMFAIQTKLYRNLSLFGEKAVFVYGGTPSIMNLNGKDTMLSELSNEISSTYIVYKAGEITIKIPKAINSDKGITSTMSIESNGVRKLIKIRGICF